MLTDDLKNLRSEFLLELRHRHEVIWRVRQVYSAALLAILVVFVKAETFSSNRGKALISIAIGSLIAVMFTDWRYQSTKHKLLRQLYTVENRLKAPECFRLGKPNQNCWDFWIIYTMLWGTTVAAICLAEGWIKLPWLE